MCMTDSRVSESNDIVMTYKVVQNDGTGVGFVFKQKNIQICNDFVTDGRVEYQTSFFDQFDPERLSVTKPLYIQICFW